MIKNMELEIKIQEEMLSEFMADNDYYEYDGMKFGPDKKKTRFVIDLPQKNKEDYIEKISIVTESSEESGDTKIVYHIVTIQKNGYEELGQTSDIKEVMAIINKKFIDSDNSDSLQLLGDDIFVSDEYIEKKRKLSKDKVYQEVEKESLSPAKKRIVLADRMSNAMENRGYGDVTYTKYTQKDSRFDIKITTPNGDIISFISDDNLNEYSDVENQHLFECVIIRTNEETNNGERYEEISRYCNFVEMNRIVIQEMRKQSEQKVEQSIGPKKG